MGRESNIEKEKRLKYKKYREDVEKMITISGIINYQVSFYKTIEIEKFSERTDSNLYGYSYKEDIEIEKTMIEIIFESGFIEHLSTFCINQLEFNSDKLSEKQKNDLENIFNRLLDKDVLDDPVSYISNIIFNL